MVRIILIVGLALALSSCGAGFCQIWHPSDPACKAHGGW